MKILENVRLSISLLALPFLIFVVSCKKENTQPPSSIKQINSFDLKKANGESFVNGEIVINIQGNNIVATVPYGTDLSQLMPGIKFQGLSISPASGTIQDFRLPVTYTIFAEDGSTATCIVTVRSNLKPIVYFGSSNHNFYALDAFTGLLLWKYSGTKSFAYSSATYADGTVYVGGIDNYVYAFDALTGEIRWKNSIATTGIESDAVFVDGTLYVGTNDDYLYALDANNGQIKWEYRTGGNVSASPTVLNGIVYFGSSDGNLYALNSANGQLKWSFQTGAMINQSGPSVVNNIVYVGSRDSYIYAVDAMTGSLIWKYFTNGVSLEQSSPTVVNGIVYIGGWYDLSFNIKGSLYAIDAVSGQLIWEKLQNIGISSSPCVAEGKIYITSDDLKIHALDATTGSSIWEKQILANSASPAVSDGTVYVGGGGTSYFYALDALNGLEKWKFPVPSGLMTSSPLVVMSSGQSFYSGDSGLSQ